MDVRIEKKPAFTLGGKKKVVQDSKECPILWEEFMHEQDFSELAKLGSGLSFGLCHTAPDSDEFTYMAGFDVVDLEKAKTLGLDLVDVPEAEYAIIPVIGAIPQSIHRAWKYAYETFFPESGYEHSGAVDFEVYADGDMTQDNYEMELWIPVIKAKDLGI